MNSSKPFEKLEDVRSTETLGTINKNQMLLTALSTTVMLAQKKVLPKEHYQWTRIYLQSVKDGSGRIPLNAQSLLSAIHEFEKTNKIEDETRSNVEFAVLQPVLTLTSIGDVNEKAFTPLEDAASNSTLVPQVTKDVSAANLNQQPIESEIVVVDQNNQNEGGNAKKD